METAIWLVEAPDSEKVNIEIKKTKFIRECFECNGTENSCYGMLIAWTLNNCKSKISDFLKFLIITPGLTVR